MNYNYALKALIHMFVMYFYFCSFNRSVQSNDKLVNSLDNKNKFRDGSQKLSDNLQKLYRKKESSHYFYSLKDMSSFELQNSNVVSGAGISSRRGMVSGKTDKKDAQVTFMSSLSIDPPLHIANKRRDNLRKIVIEDEVVDADNSDYKLEMGGTEDPNALRTRYPSSPKQRTPVGVGIVMDRCGISKNLGQRIVNGRDAEDGKYPWIVVILKFGDAWCGGAILNEWWVISASHCFMGLQDPFAFVVRVGTNNRNIGPTYKIKKLIMHERFHLDNMFNSDIALLKVNRPIKMGDLVNGICLPTTKKEEPKSAALIVAGWGATKFQNEDLPVKLQEVSLKRISDGQCARKYKLKSNTIYRSQVCTWSFGKDACQGDSGGPAIEIHNSRAVLIGIVSYGSKCADEFPGVYTQVSFFLDWITNTIYNN